MTWQFAIFWLASPELSSRWALTCHYAWVANSSFIGTNQINTEVQSIDSGKVQWHHILVERPSLDQWQLLSLVASFWWCQHIPTLIEATSAAYKSMFLRGTDCKGVQINLHLENGGEGWNHFTIEVGVFLNTRSSCPRPGEGPRRYPSLPVTQVPHSLPVNSGYWHVSRGHQMQAFHCMCSLS